MSENIFSKIKDVENQALRKAEEARTKAHNMILDAQRASKDKIDQFEKGLQGRYKDHRSKMQDKYSQEAEKIIQASDVQSKEFSEKMEKKLPSVIEETKKLIRKELCL